MRFSWLLLAGILISAAQAAEVYQYIDEHGNRVFTDKPPQHVDASEVKLPEVNRTQMPSVSPQPETAPTAEPQATTSQPYELLEIIGLPADGAIRANDGSFQVQVSARPRLAMRHRLQLLVDGQPHGEPIRSLILPAINLDRGEHEISVQVLSGDKVIQQSAGRTINILRTHINAPARRGR